MSSDPNELIRLLLAQQQQQQIGGDDEPGLQQLGAAAVANANQGPQPQSSAGGLGQMIADALKNAAGPALSSSASSSGIQLAQTLSAAPNQAVQSNNVQQQQQNLIESVKLLAGINPTLAAQAMQQALALGQIASQPSHSLQQLPQQQQVQTAATPQATNKSMSNLSSASLVTTASSGRESTKLNETEFKTAPESSEGLPSIYEPLSLLTLQSWSLGKLEAYAKKFEEVKQPIPNTLRIVLENARSKEEKKLAKRIANRKSASISRARKNQLVDELTASHARLRREVLILSYLPDPVAVIDIEGTIKFCSVQMERVLHRKSSALIGSSIEDIIVSESKSTMRRLISDLLATEGHIITANGRKEQEVPMLEVNFDDEGGGATPENVAGSLDDLMKKAKVDSGTHKRKIGANKFRPAVSSLTQKSSSLTSENSPSEDNDEPQSKKVKSHRQEELTRTRASDDVMGDSVTPNNAGAKLSSLMHYPKNDLKPTGAGGNRDTKKTPSEDTQIKLISRSEMMISDKQEDSRSSSSSDSVAREGANNSSEASGYRNSNNESSDQDSSSSGTSLTSKKMGKRHSPIAPGCKVQLIRSDLTKIWCELTSSIRTRSSSDDDEEEFDGTETNVKTEESREKEILLCFRLLESTAAGEGFPMKKNTSVAQNHDVTSTDPGTDTPSAGSSDMTIKRSKGEEP